MIFVILIVLLILFLAVVVWAIALGPDTQRRVKDAPRRALSEPRPAITREPDQSSVDFVPTRPSKPASVNHISLAAPDDQFAPWLITDDFENGETSTEGIDWLTGQPRAVCECEDCRNWRKQRVGN